MWINKYLPFNVTKWYIGLSKQKKCLVIKDIVAKSKLWEKTKVTTTLFDNFCGHEFFFVKDGLASFEFETLYTIGETICMKIFLMKLYTCFWVIHQLLIIFREKLNFYLIIIWSILMLIIQLKILKHCSAQEETGIVFW